MATTISLPVVIATAVALGFNVNTGAEVLEFHNRPDWEAAVGRFTTVDFVVEEEGFLTDEFSYVGVVFSGLTTAKRGGSYVNDGWGICGDPIEMEFAQPMWWIGADHPGILQFRLFSGGIQTYVSGGFERGGTGFFAGLLSDQPFDAVHITLAIPNVDDLHFGPPITTGDVDGDADVDFADLLFVLSTWGACPPPPTWCDNDLDGNGSVGFGDVLIVLANWTV